ncbi:MAG: FixH family protein [Ignavibacteria bacterium]|nr:FixH family protein [Ignavibacteria bacterium]
MRKLYIPLLIIDLLFFSCSKDDNPVTSNVNSDYTKILTADSGGTKFELYSKSGSMLWVGYNDIGFRVYVDGVEQKSGYVKYKPVMYHTVGRGHGTPVKEVFTYDNNAGLFTGYASYIMLSDTTSHWYGDYSFNDTRIVNHAGFNVAPGTGSQMRIWLTDTTLYHMTLVKPLDAVTGLNDIKCMLHKTYDQFTYYEVDSAEMFIKPWMTTHGHGSSSNVNPAWQNHGMYQGKANFTMAGQWFLYDSIKVNGQFITPNPIPYFVFDVR